MTTFVLTVVIFGLAALGLGLGVVFKRAPISGSCGGGVCLKKLTIGCVGGCAKKET